MKTVIKLILIYYLLQIFGSLVAAPCVMVYEFATTGTLDVTAASTEVIIPAMLLGFVFIAIYLWKNGYLVDDGRIYAFTPYSQLGWGLLAGVSGWRIGHLPDRRTDVATDVSARSDEADI